MRTRIFRLRRYRVSADAGSATLFFASQGGDRKHPPTFFEPDEIPPFEGERASFLAEWVRPKDWAIVRRVADDGTQYAEG